MEAMEPKDLVDKGACISLSQARRLIACCPIEKSNKVVYGRRKIKMKIVYQEQKGIKN